MDLVVNQWFSVDSGLINQVKMLNVLTRMLQTEFDVVNLGFNGVKLCFIKLNALIQCI